ncbi:MAG: hypothetical protein QHC90_14335 [Shinella sp.]|nr:hypothetical protein [Shinella sp.]
MSNGGQSFLARFWREVMRWIGAFDLLDVESLSDERKRDLGFSDGRAPRQDEDFCR